MTAVAEVLGQISYPSFIGLAFLAWLGHAALWMGLVNRAHAVGLSRRVVDRATHLFHAAQLVLPVAFVAWLLTAPGSVSEFSLETMGSKVCLGYFVLCWGVAAAFLPTWLWHRCTDRTPAALVSNETQIIDLGGARPRALLHGWKAGLLACVPRNQILQIEVSRKVLRLERLPRELAGLRIAHISDLHFSGRIARTFFERAVELVNGLHPDLVALTGDVCDVTACLDWIPATLGKLQSRYGTYFILGNHDLRVDMRLLRERLAAAGLVDLGGCSTELRIEGQRLLLAGNEIPWFKPSSDVSEQLAVPHAEIGRPLRVLLSHSPDQLAWARRHDFDLMLAGHTHGGQIRLPLIGPIMCPSYFGVRYASGLFHQPPTLLHVSRGLSGLTPLRLNCPPEITLLELM